MKLSQFKFKLPDESIALYPTQNRDEAKLMVLHRDSGEIEHRIFKDVLDYYDDGDTFIFNNTRVFPARLYGNKEKTGAKIEVFLLRELNRENRLWDVYVDPARKIRIGNKLYFGEDDSMVAEVIDNTTSRGRTLRFLFDGTHEEFKESLYALGEAPLPNDVRHLRKAEKEDLETFQNIYATVEGAVTVPNSGLHFSKGLMKRMEIKGVNQAFLTLHCGLGSFKTIDVEDLTKHKMNSEQMIIDAECCRLVNRSKEFGKHVCAVGATTLRACETAAGPTNELKEYEGWTCKFIFPPYEFSVCDSLIINFQLPLSPMLMEACAFGGYDLVMEGYKQALKEGYKFGTYGDAMLII